MTFTEIVFEVGDDRYPLCRLTAAPSQATAVLRVIDDGTVSGRLRTLIAFYGTPQQAASLPDELRAYRAGGELEIVSRAEGMIAIRTDSPTGDIGSNASVRIMAVLRLLSGFGPDIIVEPFVFRKGRVRARVLVPRRLDTQRALMALQDVQRSSGFTDFRVVRVSPIASPHYVEHLRRVLTPEQEDLLRLASSMGYYDTPKGATLEDIAGKVGLSVSPVHKRLKHIEETIVSTHVDPIRFASTQRRRRRTAELRIPEGSPMEIALRVRWPQSAIAQFTHNVAGSRALLQVLSIEPAQQMATFLLVVLAPEQHYQSIIDGFAKRSDTLGIEVIERDPLHVSFKVQIRLANGEGTATFPFWYQAWGYDALPRPFIFEDGEVTVRFILLRPLPESEVLRRLALSAKLAAWEDYEVLSARSIEDTRSPIIPPEPPTARQEEVLKIAHALGYYRTPRACTLEQVAGTLGVSANAIHKNLSSAEAKVVAGYLTSGM